MQYQRTRRIFNLCQLFMNVKMANVLRFLCEVFLILVVAEETLGGCTQDGSSYKCKSITNGKTTSLKVTWLKCRPPKIKVQLIIQEINIEVKESVQTFTVFDEDVDCSGLGAWWNSQSSATKTFMVVGITVLIMAIPSICWYYRRTRLQGRAVTTPVESPVQMAQPSSYTSRSNLPYSKLEE